MSNTMKEQVFIREFSITDCVNVEHKCILAAVLETENYKKPMENRSIRVIKEKFCETKVSWSEKVTQKVLSFGLSIANPEDEFNLEIGKVIAVGRAKKPKKSLGTIVSLNKSMLGSEMINALMDQQVKFISLNKDMFLKIGRRKQVAA